MDRPTVQVEKIVFKRNDERDEDGAVWYVILTPCTDPNVAKHIVCESHPGQWHHFARQPFVRGAGHKRNGINVWGWDGNIEHPTITPSFLCRWGSVLGCDDLRLHSYFTAGALNVLGDSTVVLHPSPTPCRDRAGETQ